MKDVATKERPILMHARSIKGILEGRKMQTRRIVKAHIPDDFNKPEARNIRVTAGGIQCDWLNGVYSLAVHCPYGQVGDRLWVREAFYIDTVPEGRLMLSMVEDIKRNNIYYRADGECCDQIPECSCAEVGKPKWRSAIHMPRWVCRLVLEITGIRVERAQQISEEDANAEGCTLDDCIREKVPTTKDVFRYLWDDTNGIGAWERNDRVWVIEFRKVA